MDQRRCGDHAVVEDRAHHAPEPAVFVRQQAQAIGIAQSHNDGLGVQIQGEIAVGIGGHQLEQPGDQCVTQHDGPDISRVGTGIAGAEHTENHAEGDAVEFRADQVVVTQNDNAGKIIFESV